MGPDFTTSEPRITQQTFRSREGQPPLAIEPSADGGAFEFTVNTPVGEIPILISPAGPAPSTDLPGASDPRPFRPPSIFSAPLPTGSGARALGFAGTFSAIADDATAASWNPAGLIQLKRPEASAVYRYSSYENSHRSTDPDFEVGKDDYESNGLNYLTAALPFQIPGLELNAVFSINYQEAYDFSNRFSARTMDADSRSQSRTNRRTFTEQQIDIITFNDGIFESEVEIVSDVTTESTSKLNQTVRNSLLADLQFEQQGVIDAISPAFAVELSPKFSIGGTVNFYQDSALAGRKIRSVNRSTYTSTSESRSTLVNTRSTFARYTATDTVTFLGIEPFAPAGEPVVGDTTTGTLGPVTESERFSRNETRIVEGVFEEINEYDDLNGVNATLGLLWVVNNLITVGAAVDLPWSADATQTRTTSNRSVTYNGNKTRELNRNETSETEQRDASFDFPLFANAGIFFLWTPNFYSAIDFNYTQWSDFAFNVQGEGSINPFDGSPSGQSKIDDTMSVRLGTEYRLEFESKGIDVPLRCGVSFEERPALGSPDRYYGFSLGTGIAIPDRFGKTIIDFAFNFTKADDVQTVIPEQQGLTTDTEQMQYFVSAIRHF
jgi:long-subunit fatty acid transport protein